MLPCCIKAIVLVASIAAAFTSCRKNEIEEPLIAPEKLLGKWTVTTMMDDANENLIMDDLVIYPTYNVQDEYNADGTMLRRVGDYSDTTNIAGTWKNVFDELTLSLDNGFTTVYKIEVLSNTQLVLMNKPTSFTLWTTLVKVQ